MESAHRGGGADVTARPRRRRRRACSPPLPSPHISPEHFHRQVEEARAKAAARAEKEAADAAEAQRVLKVKKKTLEKVKEIKAAGHTCATAKAAGYSPYECSQAGFSYKDGKALAFQGDRYDWKDSVLAGEWPTAEVRTLHLTLAATAPLLTLAARVAGAPRPRDGGASGRAPPRRAPPRRGRHRHHDVRDGLQLGHQLARFPLRGGRHTVALLRPARGARAPDQNPST